MESVRAAAAAAAPEQTLVSPDGSFTDETGGRLVGRAAVSSARSSTTKSDLTTSSPDSEPERAVIESYATLTRIPEGSDYSWSRPAHRSGRASDKIIEERNPPATIDDGCSPTHHSAATQRESHRTTGSSGGGGATSVLLDSATDNPPSLLQVVHDDLELSALAATAADTHAFATKKGSHGYHGKHHHHQHQRHRRLSDELMAGAGGDSYGRQGGGGGGTSGQYGEREAGGASQLSCTTLSAIMEAIKDSTESINRTISEKMRDSETMSRPRSAVSSSNSLPTASRFHSLGPHSPSPSVHASVQGVGGGGAFHQQSPYSPGVISDMVREIRENSRVREEALMANMRSIMEDRSWMQNETLTRLTRDVDDLKRGFQSVRTDVDGMKSALEGMRSEVANLGLQMNYLMAQHQLLAHVPAANYTTGSLTHGHVGGGGGGGGGVAMRRTVDHSCLQQQQPPTHLPPFYPAALLSAAAASRLSMPPDDGSTGEYGAKPGSSLYEMVTPSQSANHKAPASPRTGLLVRDEALEHSVAATPDSDCTVALRQQLQAALRVQGLYEDHIAALTRRTLSLQGEIEAHSKGGGSARNGRLTPPPDSGRPGPVPVAAAGAHGGMVSVPRDNLPYIQMLTGPVTDL
ncbi:uncharacterized protein LOC118465295 isoform X2 [Anopheles albimanus]|uniref:uncharacterized protein LOC118465295 isoform X2 n=1 Tax=Anopheles albimanus TaxID=7167 RepID=UPI00163FDA5A|nr:uncharacterized protein LOC118465295 isoform X2 [Anopheles albimanus]